MILKILKVQLYTIDENNIIIFFSILGLFTLFIIIYLYLKNYILKLKKEIVKLNKEIEEKNNKIKENNETLNKKEKEIIEYQKKIIKLETLLEEERKKVKENQELLSQTENIISNSIKELIDKISQDNNKNLLNIANTIIEKYQNQTYKILEQKEKNLEFLLNPIKDSLERFNTHLNEVEKNRIKSYVELIDQINTLTKLNNELHKETSKLVKALKTPTVRGRWGEIQLKRVVEIAGMVEYCDFYEQKSINTENGKLRPDMIITLPGERNVIVDAKAPLKAYLEAIETEDEEIREKKFKEHAQQIRSHLINLSSKSYWEQFNNTPEFVILFLPGEPFFSTALQYDPSLIEFGIKHRVILATPITLITLLKTIHYAWKQEKITQNSQKISELGKELHERLATMTEHLNKLGLSLNKAIETYNLTISSFETRVLSSARKFKELGSESKKNIDSLYLINKKIKIIDENKNNNEENNISFNFE